MAEPEVPPALCPEWGRGNGCVTCTRERSGAGVQVKAFQPVCRALHSPRGPPSASASEGAAPKMGAYATMGAEPTAEPRCPHTPTPFFSRKRTREAASSRAAAVGEAISSTERTSSHLPACRVRVRAEITARQPCRGLAPCRDRLISPHSPHNTFACPPLGTSAVAESQIALAQGGMGRLSHPAHPEQPLGLCCTPEGFPWQGTQGQ